MECLAGRLLIASPELVDPNFRRAVVLMVDHNEDGAMGVVLNRQAGPRLRQLLTAIPDPPGADDYDPPDGRTFVGGPVQPQLVTLLHGFGEVGERSKVVVPGVSVSHDLDVLHSVLARTSGAVDPVDGIFRLYCGYAGWGGGQVELELKSGSWLVVDAESNHVFDCPTGFLWGRTIGQLGEPFRRYSLMPFNPETN